MEPSRSAPVVNIAHFRKVNVLAEGRPKEADNSTALRSEQCRAEELGEPEVANAALLF
jgi:hypothetical protein